MTESNRLTDFVARLREAFDGDNVPAKNIALRKAADAIEKLAHERDVICKAHDRAWDEIAGLEARIAELEAALMFYQDKDNWKINGPLDANGANFTGGPASDVLEGKDD